MATIDGLNRLYSTSWTPLVLLRSLGLTATDALGPVKVMWISFSLQFCIVYTNTDIVVSKKILVLVPVSSTLCTI